ncbi:uncharacterized protein [Equus asinus]|uniref:uncharacterized protein n=1 Tax=Equus asinus TaxID=9793 RepID=UPI0038F717BA
MVTEVGSLATDLQFWCHFTDTSKVPAKNLLCSVVSSWWLWFLVGDGAAAWERVGGGERGERARLLGRHPGRRLPAQSLPWRSPASLCCSPQGRAPPSPRRPCPRWVQQPGPSTAMAASLRRPSLSSRSSCSPDTDDQGACEDDSIWERRCMVSGVTLKSNPRRLQFPESERRGDPASLSAHLAAPRRSEAACGQGPGVLPGGCPCRCPQSSAGGGAGQRPGSVWAAARAGSARGCWAAVRGGVGEPRLPGQSRARRRPAALCCSPPGRARPFPRRPCPRWAQQPGPCTAMAASLRRPSFSSRSPCSPDTDDRGACEDDSIWESYCDECMLDPDCGFCYKMNKSTVIDSSCVPVNKVSTNAAAWGRCENETKFKTEEVFWAYNLCPTPYSWTALLGLILYVVFFAPGMGPMPWTVNSEIYPLWARSTGNACSSGINWICNVLVSLTFLHTAEYLTYYGAFFLYAGFAAVGLLFIYGCLPETKGKKLEEIESLFDNRLCTCGASDSDEGRYIEYIWVKGSNYHLSDNDASDVE